MSNSLVHTLKGKREIAIRRPVLSFIHRFLLLSLPLIIIFNLAAATAVLGERFGAPGDRSQRSCHVHDCAAAIAIPYHRLRRRIGYLVGHAIARDKITNQVQRIIM